LSVTLVPHLTTLAGSGQTVETVPGNLSLEHEILVYFGLERSTVNTLPATHYPLSSKTSIASPYLGK